MYRINILPAHVGSFRYASVKARNNGLPISHHIPTSKISINNIDHPEPDACTCEIILLQD